MLLSLTGPLPPHLAVLLCSVLHLREGQKHRTAVSLCQVVARRSDDFLSALMLMTSGTSGQRY